MRVLLLFAPESYQYMPYLSTPLLKGYIESVSTHTVDQIDMSIEYLSYLWSSQASKICKEEIEKNNYEPKATYYHALAGYLEKNIEKSYLLLKNDDTYKSADLVSENTNILDSVKDLINYVDMINNAKYNSLPKDLGKLIDQIDNFRSSFLAQWILKNLPVNLEQYDVVGFSITYKEQLIPSLFIADLIKERFPNIKIVIGGNTITHYKKEILNDKSLINLVDYGIFYEGEYPLLCLLNHLENEDYEAINNDINVAVFSGEKTYYREDLLRKPKAEAVPNFDGINLNLFPTPKTIFPILTSKGCYWGKCTYCAHFEGYGQGFYSFKQDTIINTITTLKDKHGADYFYFVDEALPPKTVQNIAERISKINIDIKWFSEARAERGFVTPKSIKALKNSGCILLINGIESGNENVLKLMDKGIKVQDIEKYLRFCKEAGIGTAGMFFIGFPGETFEEAEDTFKFIERNQDYIDFASIGVFFMERDTPVYLNPEKFNIAEIIEYEKPYPLSYEYRMENNQSFMTPRRLKVTLNELHHKYKHLKPKFVKAIDRSIMVFIQENNGYQVEGSSSSHNEQNVKLTYGTHSGREAKLDINKKRLTIIG